MQVVLNTNGMVVKKRNNRFWLAHKDQKRTISPHRITSIAVMADCLISSAAIRLATQHGIPIYFFDGTGKATARLWSAKFGSTATIRRQQVLFALEPAATEWVISLFELKLTHQTACLQYLRRRKPGKKAQIDHAIAEMEHQASQLNKLEIQSLRQVRNQLMGLEGSIARPYWQMLGKSMPQDFSFSKRSRRPATDPFNALLNYLYGMLYHVVTGAILAAGLDPYLGFLHTDEFNRPTLSFDLIEPFRPWVDRFLVEIALSKQWQDTFFLPEKGEGYRLNKAGKAYLIPRFNDWLAQRIVFNGKRLSRRNHIYRFCGLFAQNLLLFRSRLEP